MSINKENLISVINDAFKDVTLEDGIGLSEADAIDAYADEQTRKTCREKDEKHNWISITPSELNNYYNSLHFFDAKGMRFHLPAFMLAEIRGEYNFGMDFTLTNLSTHSQAQFELFSKPQREAVSLFLKYLAEDPNYAFESDEIKRALENYWLK